MKNTSAVTNTLLKELIHLYSTTLTQCFSEVEIVRTFKRIKDLYQRLKGKVIDNQQFEEIEQFIFITNI